jgi:hypothetical protein
VILLPILYVSDMDAAIAAFATLGFQIDVQSRSHGWTEMRDERGGTLALHAADAPRAGTLELSMVSEHPLEQIMGVEVARGISDEAFGRSIVLQGPDGCEIQVNEHDRELFA